MNCEKFRERICADPARLAPALLAHELECSACAAWGSSAAVILAHWDHEPEALDLAGIGPVTCATKCAVAGQWTSHLVVQSGSGPVTVLLIPEQSVEEIVPLEFAERGLEGSLFPASAGAIAVVGERNAANPEVARQIAESVNISI